MATFPLNRPAWTQTARKIVSWKHLKTCTGRYNHLRGTYFIHFSVIFWISFSITEHQRKVSFEDKILVSRPCCWSDGRCSVNSVVTYQSAKLGLGLGLALSMHGWTREWLNYSEYKLAFTILHPYTRLSCDMSTLQLISWKFYEELSGWKKITKRKHFKMMILISYIITECYCDLQSIRPSSAAGC